MDDLQKLIARCKCGVYVTVNAHRDAHQNAQDWWRDRKWTMLVADLDLIEKSPEFAVMMATDTVVEVQFYPDTPVSFYRVLHHDLASALAEAVKLIEGDES